MAKASCLNCGKELSFWKGGWVIDEELNKFCSKGCKKEFKEEQEKIEYKRECNSCSKVWYSLKKREHEIEQKIKTTKGAIKTAGWGMLAGSWSALGSAEQSQRNLQELEKEIDRLKSCPDCGSHSYKEQENKLEK